MYSVCIHMVKVVSYYDLSVQSMSVMDFRKSLDGVGVGHIWCGVSSIVLFRIFLN